MGGDGVVQDDEVAAIDGIGDGFPSGGRSVTTGSRKPGLVVGIEVPEHQCVGLRGEKGGKRVLREGVTRAAGGGRDVEVEDVELGVPDCYGDSLDFDELVVGFGGEVCEADGVVDQGPDFVTWIAPSARCIRCQFAPDAIFNRFKNRYRTNIKLLKSRLRSNKYK